MELIWGATTLVATLLVFCLRITYIRGYKAGARRVLVEWKNTLNNMGEDE